MYFITKALVPYSRSADNSSRTASTPASNRNNTGGNSGSSTGGGGTGGGASSLLTPENTTSSIPRAPAAPKSKRTAGGSGSSGKKSSDPFSTPEFQSYLSNLSPEAGSGRSLNIDLSTALTGSEAINQLISDPDRANTLSVHLPESDDSDDSKKQQIKDTISSPQFQQALSLFSNALQSAQLGPVVSQFELTPDAVAAAYSGNLEEFVRALEKALPAGATMGTAKEPKEPKPAAENEEKPKTAGSDDGDSKPKKGDEKPE